jgi:hypothetical protein
MDATVSTRRRSEKSNLGLGHHHFVQQWTKALGERKFLRSVLLLLLLLLWLLLLWLVVVVVVVFVVVVAVDVVVGLLLLLAPTYLSPRYPWARRH